MRGSMDTARGSLARLACRGHLFCQPLPPPRRNTTCFSTCRRATYKQTGSCSQTGVLAHYRQHYHPRYQLSTLPDWVRNVDAILHPAILHILPARTMSPLAKNNSGGNRTGVLVLRELVRVFCDTYLSARLMLLPAHAAHCCWQRINTACNTHWMRYSSLYAPSCDRWRFSVVQRSG